MLTALVYRTFLTDNFSSSASSSSSLVTRSTSRSDELAVGIRDIVTTQQGVLGLRLRFHMPLCMLVGCLYAPASLALLMSLLLVPLLPSHDLTCDYLISLS